MSVVWKSSSNVLDIVEKVKEAYHLHLKDAKIAVAFDESKPFVKDRFNWGKVGKFSDFNKIWQTPSFDFSIVLCSDVWNDMLNASQQEALIDLHLCRCEVEYEPEIVMEGKKKVKVKDDLGRIKYTKEIKRDEDGNPKWRVAPLDLDVLSKNISHYGLWLDDFIQLKDTVVSAKINV